MNRLLPALALTAVAATGHAQMVHIRGGGETAGNEAGATVDVYGTDSETQSSMGFANGVHVGLARKVTMDSFAVTAGDSVVTLSLPTDLPGSGRGLLLRGALVETLQQRRDELGSSTNTLPGEARVTARAFAGWTGDGYRNAYFSSVDAGHAIRFAEVSVSTGRNVTLTAMAVHGSKSSLLASASWRANPSAGAAFTAGMSSGRLLMRGLVHLSGQSFRLDAQYTLGRLQLNPDPSLASATIERIGWNVSGNRRVGSWLWLDASRHSYATDTAHDAVTNGIRAGRSVLYEAGATVRAGHVATGVRLMRSLSGAQRTSGTVVMAGWNATQWNTLMTAVFSTDVNGTPNRSTSTDVTERLNAHLRLTQGITYASGTASTNVGGTYEGRMGSISVSHRETYIPFGNESGFHRVLAIGIRLHMGDAEIVAEHVRGGGITPVYTFLADAYRGDSLGDASSMASAAQELPRFVVRGRVLDATGSAVRGAAVRVGGKMLYTDSEGRFLSRFRSVVAVPVETAPAEFLTAETYRAVTQTAQVMPQAEDAAQDMELRVETCSACLQESAAMPLNAEDASPMAMEKRPAIRRLGSECLRVLRRLGNVRMHNRTQDEQA